MLSLSSFIYACITAFLTFFVLRLLSIPRLAAVLAAASSPFWFGAVAHVLSQVRWQWIGLLGLSIPYFLGPILVRALSRWPANPEFDPWTPKDEAFPPLIAAYFADVERAMAAEGYLPEVWLVQHGFVQYATSRMRLFVNEAEESAAIAYAIESEDPRAKQFVSYVDFISYRRDGRHRITNNVPRPSPYPRVWYGELQVFPQVRDPARLARLHRALTRRDGVAAPLPEEIRQEPLAYAADVVRRELEHLVAAGYLTPDAPDDRLRPTLLGAAMITWKMLPPAAWILGWRLRRNASAVLRAIDSGCDEQPLATPANRSSGSPALIPITSALAVLAAVAIFRLPELFGGVRLLAQATRSEAFALPGDFVAASSFPEAVVQIQSLVTAPGDTVFGTASVAAAAALPDGGFALPVRPSLAGPLVEALRPAFLARGFYVIRAEQNFGVAGAPDRVAILPTADQLEVLELVGTAARAQGRSTSEVVEWLRALDADHPLTLTGAGPDWLAARLSQPPSDPLALARRIESFCPDVVMHGTGTVEALSREIVRRGEIHCWW